jgi:RimJ/RimL family protein N-acetyltransferase
LLSPLTSGDADHLHQLYGDASVIQWITGKPRTQQETEKRLAAHLRQHEFCGFGLCLVLAKKDARLIGKCGLEPRQEPGGIAGDIAWMFTPDCWGQEYGTESATADHNNLASIAIMKHLGMQLIRDEERDVEYERRK